MKASSPLCQYLLVLICAVGFAVLSCNQPPKSTAAISPKTLEKVDKQTLLNMVADVAKTISKKGSSQQYGAIALKSYTDKYDFMINGVPAHNPDTACVYVNITGDSTVTYFVFGLPQSLKKQLTFTDLKNAYGPGTVSPRPEEISRISTLFHLKGANGVSVFVDSKNLPNARDNSIENITVMRLNP